MIENLSKVLPQLAVIAALAGILGWWLRGLTAKPATPVKSTGGGDSAKQDRVKNLETALEKSRTAHKATKTELETLQAASVSKPDHDAAVADLGEARKAQETSSKRITALEADFKKSQETIKNLNNRSNEADQARKDKSFALENELSKVRAELAELQARPNDSTGLLAEIERLREAVATSTRYAGELRKRETAALEALEKSKTKMEGLAAAGTSASIAASSEKPAAPAGESARVAAAKAEVLRLLEQNRQREGLPAEKPVAAEIPAPAVVIEPIVTEEGPVPMDAEAPATEAAAGDGVEKTGETDSQPEAPKKAAAPGELFALD